MTVTRLRPGILVASVLVVGSFGCGPAGADAPAAGEPIEEAKQAVVETECAMIFQKHHRASLRYLRGSNDVVTDFVDYDDPRSWFCLDHVGNLRYQIRTTFGEPLYLDAHENCCDHEVVLRELQNNTTQTWEIFLDSFDGAFRIRQMNGMVDVRNGGAYQADVQFPWTVYDTYYVTMDIDVPAHRYDVKIRTLAGTDVVLATDYGFRTEQAFVTTLDTFGYFVDGDVGDAYVCDLLVA